MAKRFLTEAEKEVVEHALQEVFGKDHPTGLANIVYALTKEYAYTSVNGGSRYGHLTLKELDDLAREIMDGNVALDISNTVEGCYA